ncbi:MAG: GNAT family N-acetyltransferase [Chloroflexi bacterium]|nr:GNAT family N-acetyltransferase [Chloroflexota bacterium]
MSELMRDASGFRLVRTSEAPAEQLIALLQALADDGVSTFSKDVALAREDLAAYRAIMTDREAGRNLPAGMVAYHSFHLQGPDGRLLGTIRLRHLLTSHLAHEGGHIGYAIHPAERGLGFGKLQLQLVLPIARELGLGHMLITCKHENVASAHVIEANGGVLENKVLSWVIPNQWFRRYWITL